MGRQFSPVYCLTSGACDYVVYSIITDSSRQITVYHLELATKWCILSSPIVLASLLSIIWSLRLRGVFYHHRQFSPDYCLSSGARDYVVYSIITDSSRQFTVYLLELATKWCILSSPIVLASLLSIIWSLRLSGVFSHHR
ncbi:hypothetical protein RRG08_008162 [Elysia crispata]|uniref:Uncharacterized protein n=1 Tax=Elysia crispata TaxID=231223 RepID=A0AAE1DA32_9GAST|nr:hypothetical protein RRG08_008162 [Elysia crispata]